MMNSQQPHILAGAVQHNCHIPDARHGADYSLCIDLMKMREYFGWEQRLPYGATLEKNAVGAWLQAREQRWEALEDADLAAMRKPLFPSLLVAYDVWRARADVAPLREIAERGRLHWQRVADEMLARHGEHGAGAAALIRDLGEHR